MPLNVVSYDSYEVGQRDALAIIFKDLDTEQVFVDTIDKPKYEVYILKPEYRESHKDYMDCWEHVSHLDKVTVSYKYRDQELAKILKCRPDDVKYCPFLFGYDIRVEHWYWIQFFLEYGNDLPKNLNVAFFDIESDIIQADGFAAPGEAPTSAITLIDSTQKACYTFLLAKDNLPVLAENNPHHDEYEKIRENFYAQVNAFKEDIPGFIEELHQDFDESYGVFDYNIIMFDNEIELHQAFWKLVHSLTLDIMEAWNAPYDVRNMIERPLTLGYEPESIICDPSFQYRVCFFEEDENIVPHKRNHKVNISIKPIVACQMVQYSGIRVAEGKQSLRLTEVAQKKIGDSKLNYEEEGDIKTFMYRNYRKFVKYNIKDVLLQYGIEVVCKDVDAVYDRAYENGILFSEAFVSTTLLTNSMYRDFIQDGFIMGTNSNRIMAPFDYKSLLADAPGINDQYVDPATLVSTEEEEPPDMADYFAPDEWEDDDLDEGAFDEGDD